MIALRSLLLAMVCLPIAAAGPSAQAPVFSSLDPRILALVQGVSADRLGAIVRGLEAFETRNTLSDQTSTTRGIGAAAEWIATQFRQASPKLQVSFDTYDIPAQGERIVRDTRLRNVMAVLPGRSARRIYVSGHYDTVARAVTAQAAAAASGGFDWGQADGLAPGANDDGSGTALTWSWPRGSRRAGSSSMQRSSSSRSPARSRG